MKLKGGLQHITLDAEPSPAGTVVIVDGIANYLNGWKLYNLVRQNNIPTYTRHYIKCPNIYPKHPMRWTEQEFRDHAAKKEAQS